MRDLISRQAAIDEISQYGSVWMEYTDAMSKDEVAQKALSSTKKAMIKILQNLPSVQRWIPVSERLPEEDGYYLVTNSKWGAPWREIALWITDGWQSNNKPIAWMPLPEGYQGVEA